MSLIDDDDGPPVLNARPLVRAVVSDLEDRVEVATIAARFHTDTVVLSGGVFQNRRLLGQTASLLAESGLRVLMPERLPPNDGGIAYGQLAVASARLAAEGSPDA
jgi:hydrogenase maturation protein HypF